MSARKGDALVIFGITGDLAKKMTLRSLYRLEARGLLNLPILGVAAGGWEVQAPRGPAAGAEVCPPPPPPPLLHWRRLRRRRDLRARSEGDRQGQAAGLLPRDP